MTNLTDSTRQDAELVDILCGDGQSLRGHFLQATGAQGGLPVLLSPATGVKQHFYLRFARWLAAQGHDVRAGLKQAVAWYVQDAVQRG